MSKTYKDRPEKYKVKYKRPKTKRFTSSKGRKKENIKQNLNKYID